MTEHYIESTIYYASPFISILLCSQYHSIIEKNRMYRFWHILFYIFIQHLFFSQKRFHSFDN